MAEQAPRAPELLAKVETYEAATRRVVTTVEVVVHKSVASPGPVGPHRFEDEPMAVLHRYLVGRPGTRAPRRPRQGEAQ